MRRPRRLSPYYHASCNGDNIGGCEWSMQAGYLPEVRRDAIRHAETFRHEVVVQNVNDGLVLDGRPR